MDLWLLFVPQRRLFQEAVWAALQGRWSSSVKPTVQAFCTDCGLEVLLGQH